jgi:Protein of unknown function (DUF1559)
MHNHHDTRKAFPPGAIKDDCGGTGGNYFTGWTREIMPYAEDDTLKNLYVPKNPTTGAPIPVTSTDVATTKFRETLVPLFNCPSDFEQVLAMPHSGPGDGINFRTSSYRANAGRGDGVVTWYLMEGIPSNTAGGPGLNKGWRGPVHAVCTGTPPAGQYILKVENIKAITDGTTRTLLLGESTNLETRRRTFWAYTWGNYLMSQPTPHAPTLLGDWCRCSPSGTAGCTNASGVTYGTSNRACMSGWYSNHTGGMNSIFCDGSGRFLSFDVDMTVFAGIGSIANGENDLLGI